MRPPSLYGIENWRTFYELAGAEFERARRYGHPFTLAYFDVDDFKEVNARFGHELAEGMLAALAECTHRSLRSSDVIGRLGSDAFEPARLRRPHRQPPAFDVPMPPPGRRHRGG